MLLAETQTNRNVFDFPIDVCPRGGNSIVSAENRAGPIVSRAAVVISGRFGIYINGVFTRLAH